MNVIEQTVEPKNGAIDLHIPVPEGGEDCAVKAVIIFEKTDVPVSKNKVQV
ncbi:hypothetical protein [Fibrella arboris]|uniref:hypothetical protein n=1 Tax=Fibrella arboris TaxID=3242486 RepID=UPI00351FE847